MPPSSPPVYNGRYELSHQIARGGTAQVYLARDLLLDRPVALKMLFPELSTDRTFVDRFRREAQAAANLSHPNIVPVFDWGESDRTYYIVMEYVDGEPLSAIIRTQAPLDGVQACGIAADIAKALSYAHRHGVVHRDIKPGNVLITSDGQVKVTDFGIARAIGSDENVTQTGLVMGTATYFSPEQAQGLGVDGRSDVYSLGVVLFEMLTSRPPFTGETPVSIAYQHVRETAPTPRSLNPAIPVALEAIVLQAMAKQPSERYQTAQDFQADLQRYVQGGAVLARSADYGGSGGLGAIGGGAHTGGNGAATDGHPAGATAVIPVGGAATSVMGAAAGAGAGAALAGAGSRGTGSAIGASQATAALTAAGATSAFSGATTASPPFAPPALTGTPRTVEGKPPLPKTRTLEWSIAGAVLLVAILLVAYVGGRALGYFGGKTWFPAPNLVNMKVGQAESKLTGEGLLYTTVSTTNALAAGTVVSQSPDEATLVQQGNSIQLTVSTGPGFKNVDAVEGLSQADATSDLKSQGYNVNPVLQPAPLTSAITTQGDVYAQNPAAGKSYLVGKTVTIYVVSGVAKKAIPSVQGQNQLAAASTLRNDGFTNVSNTTTQQNSPTIASGDVITTNPAPGTLVALNTLITLVVSTGAPPPQELIPITFGETPAAAQGQLQGGPYNFATQDQTVPTCVKSQDGTVIGTNPPAGTSEPQGFKTVIIEVGQYQPNSGNCTTTTVPGNTGTTGTTGTGTTGLVGAPNGGAGAGGGGGGAGNAGAKEPTVAPHDAPSRPVPGSYAARRLS